MYDKHAVHRSLIQWFCSYHWNLVPLIPPNMYANSKTQHNYQINTVRIVRCVKHTGMFTNQLCTYKWQALTRSSLVSGNYVPCRLSNVGLRNVKTLLFLCAYNWYMNIFVHGMKERALNAFLNITTKWGINLVCPAFLGVSQTSGLEPLA